MIYLWDSMKSTWKTQCRKYLKQTRVPHTVKRSTNVKADDPCFFSVVEWVGKTLRDICQSVWCRVSSPETKLPRGDHMMLRSSYWITRYFRENPLTKRPLVSSRCPIIPVTSKVECPPPLPGDQVSPAAISVNHLLVIAGVGKTERW